MMVFPAPMVVVIALSAFAAGASGSYYVMNAKRNAELVKMYRAGEKAVARKQEVVDAYMAEVAALRERKPRVVRYCPELPTAAGRPGEAGTGMAQERDLGPVLRACYDELLRCDRLREAVK